MITKIKEINNLKYEELLLEHTRNRYRKFLEYQSIANDVLVELNRVCKKNNIKMFLAYGTLLGAIRDKKPIPWDYDVDVQVFYKDKEKLLEALKQDLSSDYYVHCADTDDNSRHYMIRLSKKGYDSAALHVDVFFLVGTPANQVMYRLFYKKMTLLNQIRFYKKVDVKKETILMGPLVRKYAYAYMKFLQFLAYFVPLKFVDKKHNSLSKKYEITTSKYYTTADKFSNVRYLTKTIEKVDTIHYLNNEFYIPIGYKEILKQTYGNYLEYPEFTDTVKEFNKFLDRLIMFHK